ncbi:MAG: ATP-binding protein [Saprospiraceae bacterium]
MLSSTSSTLNPSALFKKAKELIKVSLSQSVEMAATAQVQAEEEGAHILNCDVLFFLAKTFRKQGKPFESIGYLNKAYRVLNAQFPHDHIRLSNIYREYGVLYADDFNDHFTGLEYCFKSLSLNNPANTGVLHNNIGCQYVYVGQYEKARTYLDKAKAICIDTKDHISLCYVYENFGELYYKEGDFENAIVFYKKGLDVCDQAAEHSPESKLDVDYIRSYTLIGLVKSYFKAQQYEQIAELTNQIYRISESSHLHGCWSEAAMLEGRLLLHNNQIEEFKELFDKGMQYCVEHKLYDDKKLWLTKMIDLCERIGEYKTALSYSKELLKSAEDDSKEENAVNVAKVLENKEMEILLLENRNRNTQLKKEQVEQFAFIIAHDLKTPLSNISNFVGLFSSRFGEKIDPENRAYLNYVIENAKKMHEMLDDLLGYTDVITTQNKEATDVNDLLDSICYKHKDRIAEKSGQIKYEALPEAYMGRTHLATVFQHLILNAIKFSKKGLPSRVEIKGEVQNDNCVYQIIDNGIGIRQEYHEQIFNLFKQLDKVNYKGTGMGLAICKKIVNTYGGKIKLYSNDMGGTTFEFSIPIVEQ